MKNNTNISRIQHVSGQFRILLTALIILIPVASLMYWLFFNSLPVGFHSGLPLRVKTELSLATLLLLFLVSLIPISAVLYGAVNLRKLFGLYEKGIVFSEQNVSCLRHIGYALLLRVAADFIFVFLFSLVIKFTNPAGHLAIRFGSSDIYTLIIGAVILLIAWVMKEAVVLEDEHAHTV